MAQFIYYVGKPYPYKETLDTVRAMGYQTGLLLDHTLSGVATEGYDRVVPVDFSSRNALLDTLGPTDFLEAAGLVCTYENYIVAKAWLSDHLQLAGMSQVSAEACTDKYLMRQAFLTADTKITPRFGLVASQSELLSLAAELSYPLIIKPTNLVKSLLVMRCNNEQELVKNFAYSQEKIASLYEKHHIYGRQPRMIVEEYITGATCSVAAFVDESGTPHFCEGIVALTNAQDRGIDDNYIYARQLPGSFSSAQQEEIFAVAAKGISALGMRSSPAHVELIYNDSGVKLIEIGARIGGYRPRMYHHSYGINLIEQELRLAVRQLPRLQGTFARYTAVYELFPQHEGQFDAIDNLPEDTSIYQSFTIKVQPAAQVGPAKNGYKAAAIIIVTHADRSAFDRICQSVDRLNIRTI